MNVKKIIEVILEEFKKDSYLKERFKKEPKKIIENIVEKDLPDKVLERVTNRVKVNISSDKIFVPGSNIASALFIMMILIYMMLSNFFVLPVRAAEIFDQGNLENGLKWSLTENGILTLMGEGEVEYDSESVYPWIEKYSTQVIKAVVEEGITSFNWSCLGSLENLEEICLPQSLEILEGYLFDSANVERIYLPENLAKVRAEQFLCDLIPDRYVPWVETQSEFFTYGDVLLLYQGNSSVVHVPEHINVIGEAAFANHDEIKEVILPERLQHIEKLAFDGCNNLEKLNLPDSIQSIGQRAFYSDSNKKGIPWLLEQGNYLIHNETLYCVNTNQTSITLPSEIKRIAPYVFQFSQVESIVLPEGLEEIGEGAFWGSSISKIEFPESLQRIGAKSFQSCEKLEKITLPDQLVSIGEDAFTECPLESIIIPDSLTEIGENAFGTAELLSPEDVKFKIDLPLEDLIYGAIGIFLSICIIGYVIGIFCGGYGEGNSLSKEYRNYYIFNKLCYSIVCISLVCVIILVELNISEHLFGIKWLDALIWGFFNYILPWILIISSIIWILTEIIRDDFPWGIARVGARILKLIMFACVSLLCNSIIETYKEGLQFLLYVGFAVLCFGVAWLLIQLYLAIVAILDYIFGTTLFSDFFVNLPSGITDIFGSMPKTYEDARIFKLDDDVRVIEVDGERRKLRRENPYSDTFVDVKDPTKRYKEE